MSDGQTEAPTILRQRANRGRGWSDLQRDLQLTGFVVSIRPLSFTQFGCGGRKEGRKTEFLISSAVGKPAGNADVRDLRAPKFFEVGKYLLPFCLLGSFVCVLKVVYGIILGHYQFRLKGGEARGPSAHL